jgi:hypothetical protein
MKKNKNYTKYSIGVVIFIIATMVITYFLLINKDNDDRGTIGDMFGSINALYSGLALAGIIITIIIQRDEMKLQSEEIKNQRFETSLFNLLGLHQEITKDLFSIDKSESQINGRNVFKYYYSKYQEELEKEVPFDFEGEVEDDLGHYFRNIYRILKYIDTSEFSEEKDGYQKRYQQVKFLRSQLSAYELVWICYWGMNKKRKKGTFPFYIVKYTLLKNIPKNFINNSEIKQFYKSIAKLDSEFADNQAFEINEKLKKKYSIN